MYVCILQTDIKEIIWEYTIRYKRQKAATVQVLQFVYHIWCLAPADIGGWPKKQKQKQ